MLSESVRLRTDLCKEKVTLLLPIIYRYDAYDNDNAGTTTTHYLLLLPPSTTATTSGP